jgi:hypothetical protein
VRQSPFSVTLPLKGFTLRNLAGLKTFPPLLQMLIEPFAQEHNELKLFSPAKAIEVHHELPSMIVKHQIAALRPRLPLGTDDVS